MKNQRKLKNIPCVQCEKIGVYSREMCQACYSKMLRNTANGKEKMRIYNLTKGKEAHKKWKDKQPKKEKKEKGYCSCGKIEHSKGLCQRCYQRNYLRKKKGNYQRKEKGYCSCGKIEHSKGFCQRCYQRNYLRKKKELSSNEKPYNKIPIRKKEGLFELIVSHVKDGVAIYRACKHEGIDTGTFYKNITEQERLELKGIRQSNRRHKNSTN